MICKQPINSNCNFYYSKAMKKSLLIVLLSVNGLLYGQHMEHIKINVLETAPLYLSEITEATMPICLNKSTEGILDAFMSDQFFFIIGHRNLMQFDIRGNFIREVDCGGLITSFTGNEDNQELYVSVGKELKLYDFACELKKVFSLTYRSTKSYYFKNKVWLISMNDSVVFLPVETVPVMEHYSHVSYVDRTT